VAKALPTLDKECFFVAPIGADGSPERLRSDGVLEFIVGHAAEELDLTAVRADQLAEPGQITLQVIDHILGARAAVADLTKLNPNVFYELAVRHTARLPVALIAEKDCKLPFDIAQMRTIFFDYQDLRSADQCRRDIVAHLREALEKGAVDSPIATSVDVRSMQSGNAVERSIAELVTTIEDMSKYQRATANMVEETRLFVMRAIDEFPPDRIFDDMAHRIRNLENLIEGRGLADEELTDALSRLREPLMMLHRRRRPLRQEPDILRRGSGIRPTRPPSGSSNPTDEANRDAHRSK
jgi:hypothetical protein